MANHKKSSENNPGRYASRGEFTQLQGEVKTIKLALFGEDMRGGMVKDLQEIKSATSIAKSIVVPIIVAVVSAVITAGILSTL